MVSLIKGIVQWVSFLSIPLGLAVLIGFWDSEGITKNQFIVGLLVYIWLIMTFISTLKE